MPGSLTLGEVVQLLSRLVREGWDITGMRGFSQTEDEMDVTVSLRRDKEEIR